ncbi:hypothetical protein [Azospirillum palustre]
MAERSLGWLSRYRRLNSIVGWRKENLPVFVGIAVVSLRLKRFAPQAIGA